MAAAPPPTEARPYFVESDITPAERSCMDFLKANLKVQPLPDDDFLTPTTYLRFSRARDNDPQEALTMLNACIEWRNSFCPHRITAQDVAPSIGLKNTIMAGRTKTGQAILYIRPGAANPNQSDQRVKYLVYLLEESSRLGHVQLTWVMDWSLFASKEADPESGPTRKASVQILQDYYPERLGAMYMLGQPWFISAFYYVSALFVNARTRSKIHINITTELLKEVIDENELIDFCGGKLSSDRLVCLGTNEPMNSTPVPPGNNAEPQPPSSSPQ